MCWPHPSKCQKQRLQGQFHGSYDLSKANIILKRICQGLLVAEVAVVVMTIPGKTAAHLSTTRIVQVIVVLPIVVWSLIWACKDEFSLVSVHCCLEGMGGAKSWSQGLSDFYLSQCNKGKGLNQRDNDTEN